MSRRPSIDPPTLLNVGLPESQRAWLDAHLWSEVEGRVPAGAYKQFFLDRIDEYRRMEVLDLAPLGFPAGMFVKGSPEVLRRLREQLTNHQLETTNGSIA